MAYNDAVTSEQPASKFYAPATSKQSSAPGRIERGLRSLLPDPVVRRAVSMEIPDYGFYLPGVKLSDRSE